MQHTAWLGTLTITLSLVLGASAQPQAATLDFAEAMARSREAPAVREVAGALTAKRAADRRLAALSHNPQITIDAGYRNDTGGQGAVLQVAVQQGINLAGYIAARRRSVEHEEAALALELRATLLRQHLGAARLWTDLWGTAQALERTREEAELAKQSLSRTERLYQIGAATQVDVSSARAYLAEVEVRRIGMEGEAVEQGLTLGRFLGLADAVQIKGAPVLARLPALSETLQAESLRRCSSLPEPALRRNAEQVERARADETAAQRGTQLWIGATGLHEPTAPWAAFGSLSVSLPMFERGQRERADLLASAARLRVTAQAAESSAQIELRALFHEVEHFSELSKLIDDTLVPSSAREVAQRERLLAVGDGTVLEVLLARRGLITAQIQAARCRASLLGSRYRLSLYLSSLGLIHEEESP